LTRGIPSENARIRLLQRMAFLHRESVRLCPVFFDNKLILRGEGPEYVLQQINQMLAGV
jgi:hypothetical protein